MASSTVRGEFKGHRVLHFDSYGTDNKQYRNTYGSVQLCQIVENIDAVITFLREQGKQDSIDLFVKSMNGSK